MKKLANRLRERLQAYRAKAAPKIEFLRGKALKYREKGLEFWSKVFLDENRHYVAAVSYVPFIGWLFPLYMKEEDGFCQHHAKTGFYAAFVALAVVFTLMLISIFTPREYRVIRLMLTILIYLLYLVYFTFCGYGIRAAIRSEEYRVLERVPAMKKLEELIEL